MLSLSWWLQIIVNILHVVFIKTFKCLLRIYILNLLKLNGGLLYSFIYLICKICLSTESSYTIFTNLLHFD